MEPVKDLDMIEELTDDQENYEKMKEVGLVSGPDSFLLRLQAP